MGVLYPLRFGEILRNYNFGNRWIEEEFEKEGLPEGHRIAETWEVCDRPGESSEVINGELAGSSLHDLIETYGEEFLGRDIIAASGSRFPLLVKFLDATNPLAEQVHQDDALALEQGLEDPGKTEAWYMLKARQGATIHCGTRDGIALADVHDALLGDTVREAMDEHEVHPGDAFLLHAGTLHYSHGGVLFYELLQNSNVSVQLRGQEHPPGTDDRAEWARSALGSVKLIRGVNCRISPAVVASGENRISYILASRYFVLERLDLGSRHEITCTGDKFYILTQIEGESTVACGDHVEKMVPGNTCLLSASLGNVSISPKGSCSILKAYVPDLVRDIVEPLRAAGVSDGDIVGLGGATEFNPLIELVGRP